MNSAPRISCLVFLTLHLHLMVCRYDVYRHATRAIQVVRTSCDTKLATQQLAHILHYLNNVQDAYMACTCWGNAANETWFSLELEYHMWLDFIKGAYHDAAHASIQNKMNITFNYVMERKKPDISTFSKLSSQMSELQLLMIVIYSQLG